MGFSSPTCVFLQVMVRARQGEYVLIPIAGTPSLIDPGDFFGGIQKS